MAFTNNLSVKLEYLYYDLGAVRVNNSNIGALYYTTILGASRSTTPRRRQPSTTDTSSAPD